MRQAVIWADKADGAIAQQPVMEKLAIIREIRVRHCAPSFPSVRLSSFPVSLR